MSVLNYLSYIRILLLVHFTHSFLILIPSILLLLNFLQTQFVYHELVWFLNTYYYNLHVTKCIEI